MCLRVQLLCMHNYNLTQSTPSSQTSISRQKQTSDRTQKWANEFVFSKFHTWNSFDNTCIHNTSTKTIILTLSTCITRNSHRWSMQQVLEISHNQR